MEIILKNSLLTLKEVSKKDCDPRLQPIIAAYRKRLSKRTKAEEERRRKVGEQFTDMDDFFTIYEVTNKEAYENYLGTSFPNATIYIFKIYNNYTKNEWIPMPWKISRYPDHNPQGVGHVDYLITASILVHEKTIGTFCCSNPITLKWMRSEFSEGGSQKPIVFGQKVVAFLDGIQSVTCNKMTETDIETLLQKMHDAIPVICKPKTYRKIGQLQSTLHRVQNDYQNDPFRHQHKTTLRYGVIILDDK